MSAREGMAAGVGKTFRMLQEGHAELENGHDVVIGLAEIHGRTDTATLTEGFEIQARHYVTYRNAALEEMDLPGILLRAPEVCLIDELHIPTRQHDKRYNSHSSPVVGALLVVR